MLNWSTEKELFYLGKVHDVYLGYSADPTIRNGAASGGIVSTLLIRLLEDKKIDGALVSRCFTNNGILEAETFIAKSRMDILSCQSSIYFDFKFITLKLHKEIQQFDGKIAVVGLPCNLRAIKRLSKNDENLNKKIVVTIGLFCGHNSKKELVLKVLNKKQIYQEDIASFTFRKGLWRGETHVTIKNGTIIKFPFQHFSVYQNMHILSADKCMVCTDHTAELSDISTGDIWTRSAKKYSIKHSIFFSRNENGSNILSGAIQDKAIIAYPSNIKTVFQANKRALIYHKAISARSLAGALFGKKIKTSGTEPKARWNEFLAAIMVNGIHKICSNRKGRKLLFSLPRQVIWCLLAIFKLITNF